MVAFGCVQVLLDDNAVRIRTLTKAEAQAAPAAPYVCICM
jgi:hypothetical protein